ncbi:hypothetical protein [Pararobbsia silviterrae]|uniref:SH3 domain-containing protein n=1 Tax=Pararobbsia silviterrae TaxID=1792498 RepID=A0A494XS50_9BURK|nr:hypothetical protein [Pararobbsia silviterrae]RKP53460.1 hypothetical protein D7S86_17320 [Pararobbsia silviterrae]
MTLCIVGMSLAMTASAQNSGSAKAAATLSTVVSGDYGDGMLLAADPATHAVTGYFSQNNINGQFSCIFYLVAKTGPAPIPVTTYFPDTPDEKIKGTLFLEAPGQFKIRLSSEHGGCWNVMHFADDAYPAEFTLVKQYPWLSIAVIKSERAYFFDTPASAQHRKAYIVAGDGVGVRAVKPGWLQVDFLGEHATTSGWIRQDDVYPFE